MFAVCLLLLPVVDNIYKESVKGKSAFWNCEALCWQLGDWLDLLSISRGKRTAILKLKNTNKNKKKYGAALWRPEDCHSAWQLKRMWFGDGEPQR